MGQTVVVVDSDPAFLRMVKHMLAPEGFEVIAHCGGRGAYERIREIRPDLLIVDVWLDHPDEGWNLLDALRRDPFTRRIPVLICSDAIPRPEGCPGASRFRGYRTIGKPFEVDDLLTAVRDLLVVGWLTSAVRRDR